MPPFSFLRHNYLMKNYSKHIAIIGAGISGLALGNILKKNNIPSVIFERHSDVSEYGAGISISPNGLAVLEELNLLQNIKNISGNPKNAIFYSNLKKITQIDVNVVTTSRKSLYKVLLDKYIDMNGEIFFNHQLIDFNLDNKSIFFSNNLSYQVSHIAACDGIRSICREKFTDQTQPSYSGYSVWRAILNKEQSEIRFHLGSNFHVVTYPISNNKTSFVAAIKTNKEEKDSWKQKGSIKDLELDLPIEIIQEYISLKENNDIYKWGVYIRPEIDLFFKKNISFLGDAAHPIVPFIGQGGCLALEDASIFGNLVSSYKKDYPKIQETYKRIRLPRVKKIHYSSISQGRLNHIKNPILKIFRNFLMKYTNIISITTNKIWKYNPSFEIKKII